MKNTDKKKLLKISLFGLIAIPIGIILAIALAFTVGEIIAAVDMGSGFAHVISFCLSLFVIVLYTFILFLLVGFVVMLVMAIVSVVRLCIPQK